MKFNYFFLKKLTGIVILEDRSSFTKEILEDRSRC